MKLQVVHTTGKHTELEVNKDVFGVEPKTELLAQAVHVYLTNRRQGTANTKTRSDINRTKKKWYRQKGTGNARHGARTPNIFVGGGVSHGPRGDRNWDRTMSKSQRARALIYALSLKAKDQSLMASEELGKLSAKTKDAAAFFDAITGDRSSRTLVVLHEPVEAILRSVRNLPDVLVTQANRLNVYELLLADKVVATSAAIRVLEQRLLGTADNKQTVEKPAHVSVKEPAKTVKQAGKTMKKKPVKSSVKKPTPKRAVKKAEKK